MRDYSILTPTFWIGQTGKALRGHTEAQIVAIYLLSSPHANMLGLYYLPLIYIAHETGLTTEGASKGLQRLSEEGYAHYDEISEYVWVVEMARYQIGGSLDIKDNRVKGIQREYDSLPSNCFLGQFFDKYHEPFHLKSPRKPEAPSKPLRSQDLDQDQEQEQSPSIEGQTRAREMRGSVKTKRQQSKPPQTPCPDTYEPTETQQQYAEEQHIPLAKEISKFLSNHRSKGHRMVSWEDAFWTWLHNFEQFNINGARASPAADTGPPSTPAGCIGFSWRDGKGRYCDACGATHFPVGR